MNGWAIFYLVLIGMSWGVHVAKHGQPRKPYNANEATLALGILMLLWWLSGFFQ